MNPSKLTQSLKAEAHRLGFALAGAAPAIHPVGFDHFSDWLEAGYAGEMLYLSERKPAYEHPKHVMDGVQSVLMLGMNYQTVAPNPIQPGEGRVARYAWGTADYHDLIHSRLKQLKRFALQLALQQGDNLQVRGVIDTAPLLEREFAQLAGIGWSAKNTMLISKTEGSWFFLAALLVNAELEYDTPFTANHCGTCTACLDACPTNAFPEPGVLDATKCISYLTIEHRSAIPVELRGQMGDWMFGCDICQEVCPWNKKASFSQEPAFDPLDGHNPLNLRKLFSLDDDQFRARFRKTPLWRPKRRGILRNAAIVLGNRPDAGNLAPLDLGLNDAEPLVRGAAAWAVGQHASALLLEQSASMLNRRLASETDPNVCNEIEKALENLSGS